MKKEKMLPENIDKNEIIVYQPEGGEFHIEVRVENETVWLTQAQIAELFGTKRPAITKHLKTFMQLKNLTKRPHVPFWNIWVKTRIKFTRPNITI